MTSMVTDAFVKRKELTNDRGLNKSPNKTLVKTMVWSVELYGSETEPSERVM